MPQFVPATEEARLEMLQKLSILDTPGEQIYQDAVMLASRICGTPIALVTLVDSKRQWFKAKVGVEVTETLREVSFCSHAINQEQGMVVEDAPTDSRFVHNELVTGDLHLRFYAGVPIHARNVAVGTICVIDSEVRKLSEESLECLKALARQISAVLELRLHRRENEKREAKLNEALQLAEENRQLSDYSAKRFQSLFEGMPVAGMTVDLRGNIMEWNEMSDRLFGFDASESFGHSFVDLLVPDEYKDKALLWFHKALSSGVGMETEEGQVRRKDGALISIMARSLPLHSPNGELVGLICASVDITERKRAEAYLQESHQLIQSQRDSLASANAQLQVLATTDALTGLSNRRSFQLFLNAAVASAKRYHDSVSVILLDVDNFKALNDQLGHAAGDEVLKQLAQIIQITARDCDFAGRYGGEEFILVLQQADADAAAKVAERIRHAIETAKWVERPVTASFGVATITNGSEDVDELVQRADLALYEAKRKGRNCVVVGSERLPKSA
jgi:diguanylate cyclase (GGDEF)-like protein/PAS domain S-box-containing protein